MSKQGGKNIQYLTLKAPPKMHHKMSVNNCLTYLTNLSIEANSVDPPSDCSYRSSLILDFPACQRGFENISACNIFCERSLRINIQIKLPGRQQMSIFVNIVSQLPSQLPELQPFGLYIGILFPHGLPTVLRSTKKHNTYKVRIKPINLLQ